MRLLVSWLRDFVDVHAPRPRRSPRSSALRGFEVASIEPLDGGDAVIDFEVTANRPDCLSVLGLAREVATAYDLPLTLPSTDAGARVRAGRDPDRRRPIALHGDARRRRALPALRGGGRRRDARRRRRRG